MRQRRSKTYRKLMRMYKRAFGFREPFQVLVDSELVKTAHACRMTVSKMLESVLQGTVKPMITQCSIYELYKLGAEGANMVAEAKKWERRLCNHFKHDISESKCICECVGPTNKHRYAVASCDDKLRASLRSVPGVPLLYIRRSVAILEPPSDDTLAVSRKCETQKQLQDASHAHLVPAGDEPASESAIADAETAARAVSKSLLKRKYRAQAPNPLSVKKKKRKSIDDTEDDTDMNRLSKSDPTDDLLNGTSSAQQLRRNRRKVKCKISHSSDSTREQQLSV